jgi:hypothetical protein
MRLILPICATIVTLVLSGMVQAHAAPRANTPTHAVTTHRSDGAIFPAVRQVPRTQRVRRVHVSGSRQALPARDGWRMTIEPPSGGGYVAPAGEMSDSPAQVTVSAFIELRPAPPHFQQRPNRKD